MEEYWLFWRACCLASETMATHVSLGSPFCRQLNPSCCQEVCLLVCVGCGGCFFLVCTFFSVSLAAFQHVTPFASFLSVKVFVLFRQSFIEYVSVLGFCSKANSQELGELFVCVSFPGADTEPRMKCSLELLSLESCL